MDIPERGLRSQTTIAGHPVHPMLIPFPIALLIAGLAADLAFWGTRDVFWARAAAWLIGVGVVMGALAAVFGLVDFLFIRRVRALGAAWYHFLGNAIVLLLSLWNVARRLDDAAAAVMPLGLVISAVVTVGLLITGWFGGELAYRYKIGAVDGEPSGIEAATRASTDQAQPRSYGGSDAQAMAESERDRQQHS